MKSLLIRPVALLLVAVGLLPAVVGCGQSVAAPLPEIRKEQTDAIESVHPTPRTVKRAVEQPGQIEAEEHTPLYARITGYIKTWNADIGDQVKAGQLLAELSVPEMDQELLQKKAAVLLAQADVTHAERALDTAKANVGRAEAGMKQAEALKQRAEANSSRWSAEYERARRLAPSRVIAGSEFDATQDQHRTAQAALEESKAAIQLARSEKQAREADAAQAEAKIEVARSQLRVAEADRDRMAAMVGYARIVAPFDGVVTRRQIEKGQLVQAPSGSGPSTPLFTVVRTDKVRVLVDVPESSASHVREGVTAGVRVQALGQRELAAKVTRTSWALETQTRTLRTQVDLSNEDGSLRPGMFVSVRLNTERRGALMVPVAAVYNPTDERPYVMRVEDGRVRRTYVRLGERYGAFVELLQKQMTAAEGDPTRWEVVSGREEIIASNPSAYEEGQVVTTRLTEKAVCEAR